MPEPTKPSSPSPSPAPRHRSAAPVMPEARRTPAFWVAIVVGVIAYGFVMLKLPFEGDPSTEHRLGTGCIALLAGMMVYGGARTTVESMLKGLVEILGVALFLLNGVAAALVWVWKAPLTEFGLALGFSEEHTFVKVAVLLAACAFVLDAVVFLVLYPLSRVVGARIDIE